LGEADSQNGHPPHQIAAADKYSLRPGAALSQVFMQINIMNNCDLRLYSEKSFNV
jgi:hypothetical protein